MDRRRSNVSAHAELVRTVGLVRRRWRIRLAVRGVAILSMIVLVGFVLIAAVLDQLHFTPGAVLGARVVLALLLVGAGVRYILLPLLQQVSDDRVALYIEEHEPSLQAALVSALATDPHAQTMAPGLVRRTIEEAVKRCRHVEYGRHIEKPNLQRSAAVGGGVLLAGLLTFLAGPAFVVDSARAMFFPAAAGAAEGAAVRVDVSPGSVTVPRGADQKVSVRAVGFSPDQAEIVIRSAADTSFQRMPMLVGASGAFEITLFDLTEATEYYVQSEGVRSESFRIQVTEVPYVDKLDLELIFPAYSGLPPRRIEDGGDVVALPGTVVRVRASPTRAVAGGRIVLDDGRTLPLQADSTGALTGQFQVRRTGYYHIELAAEGSGPSLGSPQYLIDALKDAAPTVSFVQPGRDTKVTSVDEVFVEARAEDDFGVASLELVYSVNGAPERTIPIFNARPLTEVSAGHTLYLEEMGLEPGDFVSYYARASDNRPGAGRGMAVSDIYFMEVRPFGRNYRQAEQGGGGMQGGGGAGGTGGVDGELSQRQREIIAATFNLVRDRETYSAKEYLEHLVTLKLAQDRLREQVLTLAQRMTNRGVVEDTSFARIAETLPRAAAEMENASGRLGAQSPQEALPPEQRALQQLQRAEAIYRDVQVAMGGSSSSSGGGSPNAEDLADLFGLELDKLKNQYEVVQRGERQEAQQEIDRSMDRLRELARRQEQENERLRKALAERTQRGGSDGSGQRQLAQQTEEEARRLEKLGREQSRPELMDAARRLQEAADAMRRASGSGRSGDQSASGEALERLREAQRRLQRQQAQGVDAGVRDALRQADRLAAEQREISRQMQELSGANGQRAAQARELSNRKDQQAGAVGDLQRQLDRLANEARGENEEAARELREAARSIRENRLEERIRQSRLGTQPNASPDFVRRAEEQISEGLEELRGELAEAGEAASRPTGNPAEDNLERAQRLAQGLESLQERMRAAREGQRQNSGQPDRSLSRDRQGDPQQEDAPNGQQGGQQQGQKADQQRGQQDRQGEQGRPGQQSQRGRQQGQQGSSSGEGGQPEGEERQGEVGELSRGEGWGGPGGNFAPEDIRQFRREARQRLEQARELREQLAREGFDVSELDRAIAGLRELDDNRVWADWEELSHLHTSLVDRLKRFEFSLRQEIVGSARERVFLSGGSEVPAEYREMVEEYYRALAEQRRR